MLPVPLHTALFLQFMKATEYCGIVFDENARNLPLESLQNGLIIDTAAAEILIERGVDAGI